MQNLAQQNSTVARVGKVSIATFKGSYRLRWKLDGKDYALTVGKITKDSLRIAQQKASQIDVDLMTGNFDPTLAKYDSRRATLHLTRSTENLLTVWESYKTLSKKNVAETTQKEQWATVDRCLTGVKKPELLEFKNASDLLTELLDKYSSGTLERVLTSINAACNLAVDLEKIERNPYAKLKRFLSATQSNGGESDRTKEYFTDDDLLAIWEAFRTDEFLAKGNKYSHSYYYPFIQFCTLTGCRPGEAIALTWDDIKRRDNGTWISFSKSYSKGILKCTKTGESRLFPVNDELLKVIESFPRIPSEKNLVFPSQRDKGYINQRNFLRRYWRVIVLKLAAREENSISKYLPVYNLRHSYITRLIRMGVDCATVGRICGTSTEMIVSHYLSPNDDYVPHELRFFKLE